MSGEPLQAGLVASCSSLCAFGSAAARHPWIRLLPCQPAQPVPRARRASAPVASASGGELRALPDAHAQLLRGAAPGGAALMMMMMYYKP
jgi:hypothetical protein